MKAFTTLATLRKNQWQDLPSSPGVYWWFFPQSEINNLGISGECDLNSLCLRKTDDGKVCLYHGMANNLAERIKWHAAQNLSPSALKSGYLSTLRLTLLALNNYAYARGTSIINAYFDTLYVCWKKTTTRGEAKKIEQEEISVEY